MICLLAWTEKASWTIKFKKPKKEMYLVGAGNIRGGLSSEYLNE